MYVHMYVCMYACTRMFFDAPLDDLSDVFESSGILLQREIAEGYTVACVSFIAMHLHAGVELSTRLFITFLLADRGSREGVRGKREGEEGREEEEAGREVEWGGIGRGGKEVGEEKEERRRREGESSMIYIMNISTPDN